MKDSVRFKTPLDKLRGYLILEFFMVRMVRPLGFLAKLIPQASLLLWRLAISSSSAFASANSYSGFCPAYPISYILLPKSFCKLGSAPCFAYMEFKSSRPSSTSPNGYKHITRPRMCFG
ncbi:hypothetical protein Nepgr_010167 [Nepenthes gracilis]|uniref:Uncharacterized protein n=1 Tax=Nepenthes gracilis TaxID=150966 RepID=A0AAD3SCW6_NEPGR|nr:hypothetical protein Nepgr_010167 [Nepenthes gracilis]